MEKCLYGNSPFLDPTIIELPFFSIVIFYAVFGVVLIIFKRVIKKVPQPGKGMDV
jgi:hypothetical protein